MSCPCCGQRDGLNTGGCLYCTARTYCAACWHLLSCSCGHKIGEHTCPNVTVVGTTEIIPTEIIPTEFIPTLPTTEVWSP